jgi:hypothetical protein
LSGWPMRLDDRSPNTSCPASSTTMSSHEALDDVLDRLGLVLEPWQYAYIVERYKEYDARTGA